MLPRGFFIEAEQNGRCGNRWILLSAK